MTSALPEQNQPPRRAELIADKLTRADFVRDLYALAEWYTANPHHPLPAQLYVFHDVPTVDELRRLESEHGCRTYGSSASHMIPGTAVPITMSLRVEDGEPWERR